MDRNGLASSKLAKHWLDDMDRPDSKDSKVSGPVTDGRLETSARLSNAIKQEAPSRGLLSTQKKIRAAHAKEKQRI